MKKSLADSEKWLSIEDIFYDYLGDRMVALRAFQFKGERGGLPLLHVDFIDDRSKTGMINGFGMNVPKEDALNLILAFPTRHEDGFFYNLVLSVINH